MATRSQPVDLSAFLDAEAWQALERWQVQNGRSVRAVRPWQLDDGGTDARLVSVVVEEPGLPTRKALLKWCPPGTRPRREPGAHKRAFQLSPEDFRRKYLVDQLWDPVILVDGGCLMFQEIAFGGLDNKELLGSRLSTPGTPEVCATVVRTVLADWNPSAPTRELTLQDLLAPRLGPRMAEGGKLAAWAAAVPDLWKSAATGLKFPDGTVTANPFALARGDDAFAAVSLEAHVGNAHGDLHPGNILLNASALRKGETEFRLIDLASFDGELLLAFDPMTLLLSVVDRMFPPPGEQRDALLSFLLDIDPAASDGGVLPTNLRSTIARVHEAGLDWSNAKGFGDEWKQATRLAMAANAMLFIGWSEQPDRQWWYFRLASQAAADFMRCHDEMWQPSDILEVAVPAVPASAPHTTTAPPATVAAQVPATSATTPARSALPPWLGPLPDAPPPRFLGRHAELRTASTLVGPGRVIPVVGPEHAGKSAFIERFMTSEAFRHALAGGKSWALLNIDVPGGGSRFPVSRALCIRLNADLFTVEEYAEDNETTERKLGYMLDRLSGTIGTRDLVTVINCARFGEETARLEADLDKVLANVAFRGGVVITSSVTDVHTDGQEQLRPMPPVRLGPLAEGEAAELLSSELGQFNVSVDAGQAIREADDSIVRRPGIVLLGASNHIHRYPDLEPRTADPTTLAVDLLDACRTTVTMAFEEAGCRLLDDSASPGALAHFMVWSMADESSMPAKVFVDAGLDTAVLERLTRDGILVEQAGAPSIHFALSRATREALRNLVLLALGRAGGRRPKAAESLALGSALGDLPLFDGALSRGALALFDSAFSYAGEGEGDEARRSYLFSIECVVGWLGQNASGRLPRLERQLEYLANSIEVEALILPVEPNEQPDDDLGHSLSTPPETPFESLYRTVSQLNVRMRAPATRLNGRLFVDACARASDALRGCAPGIPQQMLRSIDSALHFGGFRFQCMAEILSVRSDLIGFLVEECRQSARGRVGRVAWTVSWLINTADLQLDAQKFEESKEVVRLVLEMMDLLPEADTQGGMAVQLGLGIRAARLQARTADDETERAGALSEAVRLSRVGMEHCAPTTGLEQLWIRRYLDALKNYAFEMRSDEERALAVHSAKEILTSRYGHSVDWGLEVCLMAARFMQATYRRYGDPSLRLEGAEEVVTLLDVHKEDLSLRASGQDVRGMLELAKAYSFKAWALWEGEQWRPAITDARLAEQYAEKAVRLAPSTASYMTWLECLRQREQWEEKADGASGRLPALRRAVQQIKQWLSAEDSRSANHANLARMCIEEEWSLRGRTVWSAASRTTGDRSAVPIDVLQSVYAERAKVLDGHEKRYGPTVETLILRSDLEREYRRLITVHSPSSKGRDREVDNSPTWTVLNRATELWPHNRRIRLARAHLHRYLWEYEEAFGLLESVIRGARSGSERRRTQIDIAEVSLQAIRFDSLGNLDRDTVLEKAAGYLSEPLGHNFQSQRVAVLRARLALESSSVVDWDAVNSTFEELIGAEYSTTIGLYLQSQRRVLLAGPGESETAEAVGEASPTLTELLYENFTDADLIEGLGQLYLRRAELLREPDGSWPFAARQDAAEAARQAYDCFDACRVLESASLGNESSINRFRRAEAIYQAAMLAETPNPLPWTPETKSSWLKLAIDLYQSAASRSVGSFYELCRQRIAAAQRLLNAFKNDAQDR